jgi:hypothetical protein
MTKKIAISVPDDVADQLSTVGNVSAYITEAVRRRMRVDQTRAALLKLGFDITDDGVARMRHRVAALEARSTPQERAAAWDRIIERAGDDG